jgi:predicted nucleotidyltransferase
VWRQNFIDTFLTRDASRLGINLAPEELRRFWTMLAHLHGGLSNFADIARTMSISHASASKYVDVLTHAFLLRRLQPYFANISKRLVKSPKIYLRDSGILQADSARIKKIFYVLRPLFALRWIRHQGTQPPTEFSRLLDVAWVSEKEREMVAQLQISKAIANESQLFELTDPVRNWLRQEFIQVEVRRTDVFSKATLRTQMLNQLLHDAMIGRS